MSKPQERTRVLIQIPLLAFFVLLGLAASQLRAQNRQDKNNVPESYPIVDYNASLPTDADSRSKREAANRAYDGHRLVTEDPPKTQGGFIQVTIISDYLSTLPALPIRGSTAIVLGSVSDARAFLSNDKAAVYSEFSIKVDKVFKDAALSPWTIIKVDRLGGRVRYSANQTVWYHTVGETMPQPGQTYLFFLHRHRYGDNYAIMTAYELRSGRVHPLDGNQPSSSFAGAVYENVEEEAFLRKVQEAVTVKP